MRTMHPAGFLLIAAIAAAACSDGEESSAPSGSAVVLAVAPAANSTGVSPTSPITVTFNHPMMVGMELLVILHNGTVTGPEVAGTWEWSPDRATLTFLPNESLAARTTYVLHLSPNLKDAAGNTVDFAACAGYVRGQPVPGGMFGWGGSCGRGPGWNASPGTWGYGMFFTFTTA
jgi:hypothetical protein